MRIAAVSHALPRSRLTTADVLYTYQTIQNPDARSPLFTSWQGVKLEVRDERTIVFILPGALGAFTHSLTNGIVPKHVLENTPPSQLAPTPSSSGRLA